MKRPNTVYRIIHHSDWKTAQLSGTVPMLALDKADGFVHLSTQKQAQKTLELYFKKEIKPLLLAIDVDRLKDDLRWEAVATRNGALFPHLYRPLLLTDILATIAVEWSKKHQQWLIDGKLQFGPLKKP